jgi:hypothetical protein
MHGTVEAGLLSLSRRDLGQNLATRMRMARSTWASTSLSWLFSLPVSALTLLDRGRRLAVLICRNTKLKVDLSRSNQLEENL